MCLSKACKLGEANAQHLTWAEPQASNVWLSLGKCIYEHTWHWCALAHTCAHDVLDALLVMLVCPVCPTRHLTSREPLACCTAPPQLPASLIELSTWRDQHCCAPAVQCVVRDWQCALWPYVCVCAVFYFPFLGLCWVCDIRRDSNSWSMPQVGPHMPCKCRKWIFIVQVKTTQTTSSSQEFLMISSLVWLNFIPLEGEIFQGRALLTFAKTGDAASFHFRGNAFN